AVGNVHVPGPDARAEAELGIVGDVQRFGLVLEGGDADHRAEDFLLEHTHLVVSLEQGRFDVVTAAQFAFQALGVAADKELGTLLPGNFHIGQDLVELLFRSLRADLSLGIQRIAAFDTAGTVEHAGGEVVVHAFLDQCPGWAGADLTLVEESQYQPLGSLVDKALFGLHDVGEVDIRGLAPQLGGGRDDVLRRTAHDVPAHRGGAGEGDLGDTLAGGQRLAGFPAIAVDDIEHARWQEVGDQLGQYQDADRGLFGRLEYNAVTRRQRWRQL